MDTESLQPEPFRPSLIHKLFSWVEQLPGPYWLYYLSIIVVTGVLNHIVAWREGILPPRCHQLAFCVHGLLPGVLPIRERLPDSSCPGLALRVSANPGRN